MIPKISFVLIEKCQDPISRSTRKCEQKILHTSTLNQSVDLELHEDLLVSPTKECLHNQIDQFSRAIVRSKELILLPAPWARTHDGAFIRAMLEHG